MTENNPDTDIWYKDKPIKEQVGERRLRLRERKKESESRSLQVASRDRTEAEAEVEEERVLKSKSRKVLKSQEFGFKIARLR